MNKLTLSCILAIYIICNVLFYMPLWEQVTHKGIPDVLVIQGESPVYEFIAEYVRKNILAMKNPFTPSQKILYPFGWNFVLDDVMPIYGFYFLATRPTLGIHQSFMLLTLLASLLSSISMFVLLRRLKISSGVSFIGGFIYGFSPFMSMRISAHPPYAHLYVFPLIFLCIYNIIDYQEKGKKLKWSLMLGIISSVTILTNLYFTAMSILLFILLNFSFLLMSKRAYITVCKKNVRYIVLAAATSIVILLPWLYYVLQALSLTAYNNIQTLDQSIAFSADLMGFFTPSRLNPLLGSFTMEFGRRFEFYRKAFETFVYPGIVVLAAIIVYPFIAKKLSKETSIILKPFYITTVFLIILACGPYLQIFGRQTQIVLPYILFNKIPLATMIRSPARLVAVIIFTGTIIAAFLIEVLYKKFNTKKKVLLFLFVVVFIDLAVSFDPPLIISQPSKIYHKLSESDYGSVLEIPFSIRDSVKKFGSYHTVWSSRGQLAHEMPIFSIYTGRVSDSAFIYFSTNPIFIYLNQIINENNPPLTLPTEADINFTADFLNMKYAILKNNERYKQRAIDLLKVAHFIPVMQNKKYSLWERPVGKVTQTAITFESTERTRENLMFGEGWAAPEKTSRWAVGKVSNIYFRTDHKTINTIELRAEAIVKNQNIKVYINNGFIGNLGIPTEKQRTFRLAAHNAKIFTDDLNILTLKFSSTHQLARELPNSKDYRPLALNMTLLKIE